MKTKRYTYDSQKGEIRLSTVCHYALPGANGRWMICPHIKRSYDYTSHTSTCYVSREIVKGNTIKLETRSNESSRTQNAERRT